MVGARPPLILAYQLWVKRILLGTSNVPNHITTSFSPRVYDVQIWGHPWKLCLLIRIIGKNPLQWCCFIHIGKRCAKKVDKTVKAPTMSINYVSLFNQQRIFVTEKLRIQTAFATGKPIEIYICNAHRIQDIAHRWSLSSAYMYGWTVHTKLMIGLKDKQEKQSNIQNGNQWFNPLITISKSNDVAFYNAVNTADFSIPSMKIFLFFYFAFQTDKSSQWEKTIYLFVSYSLFESECVFLHYCTYKINAEYWSAYMTGPCFSITALSNHSIDQNIPQTAFYCFWKRLKRICPQNSSKSIINCTVRMFANCEIRIEYYYPVELFSFLYLWNVVKLIFQTIISISWFRFTDADLNVYESNGGHFYI